MDIATESQMRYIRNLAEKLGYDEADIEEMIGDGTKAAASELIDSLKDELGWD